MNCSSVTLSEAKQKFCINLSNLNYSVLIKINGRDCLLRTAYLTFLLVNFLIDY